MGPHQRECVQLISRLLPRADHRDRVHPFGRQVPRGHSTGCAGTKIGQQSPVKKNSRHPSVTRIEDGDHPIEAQVDQNRRNPTPP